MLSDDFPPRDGPRPTTTHDNLHTQLDQNPPKPPLRLEGLSLPVSNVARSVAFYDLLGFEVEQQHGNAFALLRLGGGTLGLLNAKLPDASASQDMTRQQRATIQVELTADDLDGLYARLIEKGVTFHRPPHDDAWERSMQCFDPDGYTVEFAQGLRGHNEPASPTGRARTIVPDDAAQGSGTQAP